MIFLTPFWLILLLPAAACYLKWRHVSALVNGLSALTFLLLVVALCRPAFEKESRTGTVVVVADRSKSMPRGSAKQHQKTIEIIQSAMSAQDRLAVVSFGRNVVVDRAPQHGAFAGFISQTDADQSRLAAGLSTALSLISADSPGRILLLSDGLWTGRDPDMQAADAAARAIPIDYREYNRPGKADLSISRIHIPPRVRPGEAFMIKAEISNASGKAFAYELRRNNRVIARGEKGASPEKGRMLLFRDRIMRPGTARYILTVNGDTDDPIPENNQARFIVGSRGTLPVLCVSAKGTSGFARLLRENGIDCTEVSAGHSDWSLTHLSGYSALIVENTPSQTFGRTGMNTIAAWVRETGSGLMMTGGSHAFGPGGYFRSPLEPVLPISMELRKEHRKLQVAIVVVLDRSGSMSAGVGGGKTKMDLANIGTAQVLDLLSENDEFGVIAVDSTPHTMLALNTVAMCRARRNDILRIQSMGGGIYVYQGLLAAAKMLENATSGTRHIVLFADAADAEEPGKYKELLRACAKSGITVSVIGLGTASDHDAPLLTDIAVRGNGRSFFTNMPRDLPRLFAQDTFSVARNAFIKENTPVRATPELLRITGPGMGSVPKIGGYSLCYPRPESGVAVITKDEYKAPVLAFWHAEKGRVLCYTGEAAGEHTGPILNWKNAGDFFASQVRWVCGGKGDLPEDMLLTRKTEKGALNLTLHLDPERTREPFSRSPRITVLRSSENRDLIREQAVMKWTSADTLSLSLPISGEQTILPVVNIPGREPFSLSPACLPYSPEYMPVRAGSGTSTLKQLARYSNGKQRVRLDNIWEDIPRKPQFIEFGHWFALAALVLFLTAILQRRTGIFASLNIRKSSAGKSTPSRPKPARTKKPSPEKTRSAPKPAKSDSAPTAEQKTQPAKEQAPSEPEMSPFEEARKRAQSRTQRGNDETR